ncbi:radical SAM protein [Oceanicoccus sagamiensis]|uniref:radical SAM protein n=1 Tax=Oceanicoccus sagamiensis TaxID=716816 RepID=UPI00146AB600|nr:radical SAM protein [Oceanicoccus sagamiensis]
MSSSLKGGQLNELAAKGFYSESDTEALSFSKAAELNLTAKFSKGLFRPSLIMVVPTLRCDHDCAYCQVSRAPLSSVDHELEMKPAQIAQAIDKIAAPAFKLEIQGGEPLLRPRFIIDLVKELRVLRGHGFDVVIASALGPDMSDDFLEWMHTENVSLSVSFDGIPSVHSKIRKSRLFDSFERFKQQLKRLSDANLSKNVGFVSTITREIIELGPRKIISACSDLGIRRIYSRPIANYGFATVTKKLIGYSRKEYSDFLEAYIDEIVKSFQRGEVFFDEGIGLYLSNLYSPELNVHVDMQSPSGYALSACIVNYDGNIFGSDEARMLFESTKNPLLPLARISGSELLENNIEGHEGLISSSFSECSPLCDTCAYMPFCGSDPVHHLASQGDFVGLKPNSGYCHHITDIYDILIKKIGNGEITNKMVVSWLKR